MAATLVAVTCATVELHTSMQHRTIVNPIEVHLKTLKTLGQTMTIASITCEFDVEKWHDIVFGDFIQHMSKNAPQDEVLLIMVPSDSTSAVAITKGSHEALKSRLQGQTLQHFPLVNLSRVVMYTFLFGYFCFG